MSSTKFIKIYTDGASRGNPGKAAIGIAIFDEKGALLISHKEYIGKQTNNFAEYSAILKSIDLIRSLETDFDRIEFYSDSELLVNQLTGKYILRNERLKEMAGKFMQEIKTIGKHFDVFHVKRDMNKAADKLANEAINEHSKKASTK